MKQYFIVALLLLAVTMVFASVDKLGAQDAQAVLTTPDSAKVAGSDSVDAQLPADSFIAVDSMPQMLQETKPEYPEVDRKAGIEGKIWVKVLVTSGGNVAKAIVLKREGGSATLERAATAAALQNKFKPAKLNGKPVAVWVTYAVSFKLANEPKTTDVKSPDVKK